MYVLLFIFILLIVNLIYNFWNYKQCEKHIKRFTSWLLDKEFNEDITADRPIVKRLVKNAGCYDVSIPVTRPMGLGQIINANINPIEQYPNRMSDIVSAILNQLESSKGVYKQRMAFSINPILWIEFIIYLPSNVIKYLGFKNETVGKFFNVLWWVCGTVVLPILINIYSEEITHFFRR